MSSHRFQWLTAEPAPAAVPAHASFVPCPAAVLAAFSPVQQATVADIYRLAREMTEAQLRPAQQFRMPAFSMN